MVTKLQGAIIAAGRGERLRNESSAMPKPLVELGGETMLARQARALIAAGASSVIAVINSETARIAQQMKIDLKIELPAELKIVVRDTPSSMETMLALGEYLEPGWFLAATVDAIVAPAELARFVAEARRMIANRGIAGLVGVLAVTRWRGDRKPLFAELTNDGLIARLGGAEASMVTAGIYLMHTEMFELAESARSLGLDALRRLLGLMLERGMKLGAIEIAGAIDVDEASDLEAARSAIRSYQ
ncbi:MAG: NTP transferase domain-containing protein [Candidatus Binatus sp.]|uniref:nucleotidyltransferase family protein n=1 Tax=Candidatus Binatus sp. TaxID=2811406 RepID=UPI002728BFA6|nr:NTP transferase domain-containing protein [Candidatus Binatus sp.]MDO8431441.1 NTP transferase domain-containing protein [Candidatus Binatus sp.]